VALLASCIQPKPLPVLGEVPVFKLTSESGQAFDGRSLDGHVWVADFVYTTCTGPCPTMSSKMHLIQDQTAADMPDVRFVSFTVDPVHDTPAALAEYGKHFKQDPSRWVFLTGDAATLNQVGLNGFKLNGVDGSMGHSTRFALVDRQRRIRGYYITGEDGFLPKLMHDIRQLERDRS
jgi:protein SCO1